MNKYKIKKNKNKHFQVVEIETENVLKTFCNFSDAKKLQIHLNLGGGFNGFTPNFMRELKT